MTRKNRSEQINESTVGIYHISDRCVRGAFLINKKKGSHESDDDRRDWLHERLVSLAEYFLIDIIAFAILCNHMHLILRNRPDLVEKMSNEEVIRAWWGISPTYRRNKQPGRLTPKRLRRLLQDQDHIRECRERLSSISWFMRYLKHPLALLANDKDKTSGHFWQARFHCRPLDSLEELLTAMVYVDLNPIRAGMANSVADSRYTSAFNRVESAKRRRNLQKRNTKQAARELKRAAKRDEALERSDEWLTPIQMDESDAGLQMHSPKPTSPRKRASDRGLFSMETKRYLMLVDFVGRVEHQGKRGKIPADVPRLLDQLGFGTPDQWLKQYRHYTQTHAKIYHRKVNTDEEAELVELPLIDPNKTNQDALL